MPIDENEFRKIADCLPYLLKSLERAHSSPPSPPDSKKTKGNVADADAYDGFLVRSELSSTVQIPIKNQYSFESKERPLEIRQELFQLNLKSFGEAIHIVAPVVMYGRICSWNEAVEESKKNDFQVKLDEKIKLIKDWVMKNAFQEKQIHLYLISAFQDNYLAIKILLGLLQEELVKAINVKLVAVEPPGDFIESFNEEDQKRINDHTCGIFTHPGEKYTFGKQVESIGLLAIKGGPFFEPREGEVEGAVEYRGKPSLDRLQNLVKFIRAGVFHVYQAHHWPNLDKEDDHSFYWQWPLVDDKGYGRINLKRLKEADEQLKKCKKTGKYYYPVSDEIKKGRFRVSKKILVIPPDVCFIDEIELPEEDVKLLFNAKSKLNSNNNNEVEYLEKGFKCLKIADSANKKEKLAELLAKLEKVEFKNNSEGRRSIVCENHDDLKAALAALEKIKSAFPAFISKIKSTGEARVKIESFFIQAGGKKRKHGEVEEKGLVDGVKITDSKINMGGVAIPGGNCSVRTGLIKADSAKDIELGRVKFTGLKVEKEAFKFKYEGEGYSSSGSNESDEESQSSAECSKEEQKSHQGYNYSDSEDDAMYKSAARLQRCLEQTARKKVCRLGGGEHGFGGYGFYDGKKTTAPSSLSPSKKEEPRRHHRFPRFANR